MRELDTLVRAPFALASTLRRGRAFYTHGVVAQGHAELGSHWWPVQGRIPVTARLSRGAGLPGLLPDALALAVRLHLAGGPWDLLLMSAPPAIRMVPLPALGWSSARYSSVAAFRTAEDDRLTWVLAEPESGQPRSGSLTALAGGDPPHFTLALAGPRGDATPAGRLSLDSPKPAPETLDPPFDPILHRPGGVETWPEWVASASCEAYGASHGEPARQG